MGGETIVIKGVDKGAYRKLKSKAAKQGLSMGRAATLAFNDWSKERESLLGRRLRDPVRMQIASNRMDKIRIKQKADSYWSAEKVIREWREKRRH
jgi:hypothetical protein